MSFEPLCFWLVTTYMENCLKKTTAGKGKLVVVNAGPFYFIFLLFP